MRNGEVAATIPGAPAQNVPGRFLRDVDYREELTETSWLAVRCFETLPDGRIRFAHTAPVFFDVPDKPLRPRRDQARYLLRRVEEEIARNREILGESELAEYREALEFYRSRLTAAR